MRWRVPSEYKAKEPTEGERERNFLHFGTGPGAGFYCMQVWNGMGWKGSSKPEPVQCNMNWSGVEEAGAILMGNSVHVDCDC